MITIYQPHAIPKVTKIGRITGSVERWDAHKKGILHKAFSVALFYNDNILLQVRKHTVFDSVIDATASSHPEFIKGAMEDEKTAVIACLRREWHVLVSKNQLTEIGSLYYRARDPLSTYIEHEYCTFYKASIDRVPFPDNKYAYGYTVVSIGFLKKNPHAFNLAPWIFLAIKNNLI